MDAAWAEVPYRFYKENSSGSIWSFNDIVKNLQTNITNIQNGDWQKLAAVKSLCKTLDYYVNGTSTLQNSPQAGQWNWYDHKSYVSDLATKLQKISLSYDDYNDIYQSSLSIHSLTDDVIPSWG